MKKTLLLIAVISATFFASCKKDRTCTCVVSNTNSSGTSTYTTVDNFEKISKKDARANCMSETYNYSAGASGRRDCTLK